MRLLAATILSALCCASTAQAQTLLDESFESGLGAFSNTGGDDMDWTRDSGGTPSDGTGPSADHTLGSSAGFYVYTEASNPNNPNRTALLLGPCLDLSGRSQASWTFWYHMLGTGMGSLHAEAAAGCGSTWTTLFTRSGSQGSAWLAASVDLAPYLGGTVRIRFRGVTGTSFSSDMAIDDVRVTASSAPPCTTPAQCDDGLSCTADACVAGFCQNADTCPGNESCDAEADACVAPPGQFAVDALDLQRFKAHIAWLSSSGPPINGSRHWSQPGNAAALDYLEAQLASYGYTVHRHSYVYSGQTRQNVYATKVGALQPDRMYLVSAHMDSRNTDSPGDVFAPGANDDASGTSLVLEAARVFAPQNVVTDTSIRFVLWNNEETGLNGSAAYVSDRAPLRGIENPAGSGLYPEPIWLGMIQHDMMMFDHGLPPQASQIAGADVDIEYQSAATFGGAAIALAQAFHAANATYATDYPAEVSGNMSNTDSWSFRNHAPAISLRENRRVAEIGNGSNPHWHKSTDVYATFSEADFLLGFNALQTTVGAVAELARARAVVCGDGVVDGAETCDDGNTADGDCCSSSCQLDAAGASCSDADACTEADACNAAGQCVPGAPLVCDDGLFCNGAESCDPAQGCLAGAPPALDDGVACTDDACDEALDAVVHTPLDAHCGDGMFCNGAETCHAALGCLPGAPPGFDDGIACTSDACDEDADAVVHTPLDAQCASGDPCIVGRCDLALGCSFEPVETCSAQQVPAFTSGARVAFPLLLGAGALCALAYRARRSR